MWYVYIHVLKIQGQLYQSVPIHVVRVIRKQITTVFTSINYASGQQSFFLSNSLIITGETSLTYLVMIEDL